MLVNDVCSMINRCRVGLIVYERCLDRMLAKLHNYRLTSKYLIAMRQETQGLLTPDEMKEEGKRRRILRKILCIARLTTLGKCTCFNCAL
jgi:hypothetical protein